MRKILTLIFLAMFCFACDMPSTQENVEQSIEYVRDTKVNICYGIIVGGTAVGLTIVPCEKVEHLIKEKK